MAEVEVRDLNNKVVEKLSLADEVFNYEASPSLVWEAVTAFTASQRKGTHSTKNRAAVRGGNHKPWRQKGTGRARAGTVKSPIWAGGGTIHGPQPRDYSQPFPKKKRRGAMKLVLTDKLKNEHLLVLKDIELDSHRTKEFAEVISGFEVGKKVLVVDSRENRNLYLSSRNLPSVKMVASNGVNVYDLVNHEFLMISKKALLELQETLKS
jgi:large subunit ribosomal protein L4